VAVATPHAAKPRTTNRWRLIAVGVIVVAAIIFLVTRAGDAAVFFKTADEAVRDKDSLGDRRFQVEGVVQPGSVRQEGNQVEFDIAENGVVVHVIHAGDQPQLFQTGIPVVLQGKWSGDHYASDKIIVKHSEEYKEKNPDRVNRGTPAPAT
jgi:cytochrome c-type biogenesis protein CcmE